MDELHVLLRDEASAKGVLTELRADLNQPANCIAVLFADRYTLKESERKVQSEIWLQLTEIKLGPLDRESTESAIIVPCTHRDASFLREAISEIYKWTNGYPFHVQRMVQNIIEKNYRGPWVTALPQDVNEVVPRMVEQDSLFRQGLCRPERIDAELQCAIAAILEFKDLCDLLPRLSQEEDWKAQLASFSPRSSDLLATFADPEQLLARLENVGLLRPLEEPGKQYEIFSPLLEKWLRRQRDNQRPLYEEGSGRPWALSVNENVFGMNKDAWLSIDGELAGICEQARVAAPLKIKRYTGSWDLLTVPINSREAFRSFCQALQDCFVEGRAEVSLVRYPWLFLAFHRTRLVRNFFHHDAPSQYAKEVWRQVCVRGIGGNARGEDPADPDDWRAIQLVMLRTLEIGLRSAIATVKGIARTNTR